MTQQDHIAAKEMMIRAALREYRDGYKLRARSFWASAMYHFEQAMEAK